MAWLRGEIYVYEDVSDRRGEVRCCNCRLKFRSPSPSGVYEGFPNFIAHGLAEMADHLEEHVAAGQHVPAGVIRSLRATAKTRKPVKHPVHLSTNKIFTTEKKIVDHFFQMPLCGWQWQHRFDGMLPDGKAHMRDELTMNRRRVTCKHCKKLAAAGHVAVYQTRTQRPKRKVGG